MRAGDQDRAREATGQLSQQHATREGSRLKTHGWSLLLLGALSSTLGCLPPLEPCAGTNCIPLDAGSIDAGSIDAGSIDAGSTDAGSTDAGSTDAGSTDAGSTDAGSTDAGSTDAGSTDAGSTDAGFTDAGFTDAGVDAGRLSAADIQRSLDALAADGGGTLHLGAGTYDLDRPILLRSWVRLEGEGAGTVLRPLGQVAALEATAPTELASVRDLTIDGTASPHMVALRLHGVRYSTVKDVTVRGLDAGTLLEVLGSGMTSSYFNVFERLTATSAHTGVRLSGALDSSDDLTSVVTLDSFVGLRLQGITGRGVDAVLATDHETFLDTEVTLAADSAVALAYRSSARGSADWVNHYKLYGLVVRRAAPATTATGVAFGAQAKSLLALGLDFTGVNATSNAAAATSYFLGQDFALGAQATVAAGACAARQPGPVVRRINAGATAADINAALQLAAGLDGGATVELGTGAFVLTEPLVLRSDVALRGQGPATRLVLAAARGVVATGTTRAHLSDVSIDAQRSRAAEAIAVDGATGLTVRDVDVRGLWQGTLLTVRSTTAPVEYSCFANLRADGVRRGVVINDGNTPAAAVQQNQFRTLKLFSVGEVGLQVAQRSRQNLFADVIVWLASNAARGVALSGASVTDETFLFPVLSMEGHETSVPGTELLPDGGVTSNASLTPYWSVAPASEGFAFTSTQGHRVWGYSFSHWNWALPVTATGSANLWSLGMITSRARGASDLGLAFTLGGLRALDGSVPTGVVSVVDSKNVDASPDAGF